MSPPPRCQPELRLEYHGCEPGYALDYQAAVAAGAATDCVQCPIGKKQPAPNQAECDVCDHREYQPETGQVRTAPRPLPSRPF